MRGPIIDHGIGGFICKILSVRGPIDTIGGKLNDILMLLKILG